MNNYKINSNLGDSSLYARYVFQAMFGESIAKNEPITFLEYAKALSTLCRGTIMDKITWIFQLYDINHDGLLLFMFRHYLFLSILIYRSYNI